MNIAQTGRSSTFISDYCQCFSEYFQNQDGVCGTDPNQTAVCVFMIMKENCSSPTTTGTEQPLVPL